MSSSLRNGHKTDSASPWQDLPVVVTCPECGKKSLRRVRKDYEHPGGGVVKNLERFQCSSCLSNFFDDAAMQVLEVFERRQKSKRRSAKPASFKPANAAKTGLAART